jgi:hypothetical protein
MATRIPGLRCAPTWALESRPFGAKNDVGSGDEKDVRWE